MRGPKAPHDPASIQTPGLPGVFFEGYHMMINRYMFEVIFSAVTLCGLIVAWELFLADGFL